MVGTRLSRSEMRKELTKEAGEEAEWRCGHKQHRQQGNGGVWDPSGSGFGVTSKQGRYAGLEHPGCAGGGGG